MTPETRDVDGTPADVLDQPVVRTLAKQICSILDPPAARPRVGRRPWSTDITHDRSPIRSLRSTLPRVCRLERCGPGEPANRALTETSR